uniref:Uncharacterized protein n=1 Tax=Caudovirales sp. ctUL28 TaxID=2826778 RepID=A0A8S5MV09_9CAUD|nr:MAG TPA: hypothetical protein [Caudovirales sp. ctUL28]
MDSGRYCITKGEIGLAPAGIAGPSPFLTHA